MDRGGRRRGAGGGPALTAAAIRHVRAHTLAIPFGTPLATAGVDFPAAFTLVVEVETEPGLTGVGWTLGFSPNQLRALVLLVADLGELLAGRDATEPEAQWSLMTGALERIGPQGLGILAIAALDIALWDVAARAAGRPLREMLGGGREWVEVYASHGLWLDRAPERAAEEAAELAAAGFRALKLRLGRPQLEQDLAVLAAVRAAVGPEVVLMADVNQGWDFAGARRAAPALAELDLRWLEDPLPRGERLATAELRRHPCPPICAGESEFADGLRELLERESVDLLMADVARVGGVTGWRRAAAEAAAREVEITPHLFPEVSAQLVAATPNGRWVEWFPFWQPLFASAPVLEAGRLHLPHAAGLGVELDQDSLRRYAC